MSGYFRKYDYRLWLLSLGWFSSAVGFAVSIPFIAIYFHSELGISLTGIGLFFSVAAVIRAFTQAFGGDLSDRIGRYRLMVTAQIVRSFVFAATAYAIYNSWGFYAIGALLILNSIFGALFQPAANAMVADLTDKKNRTEAYAIVRASANLGWALGPAVGGFLAAYSYGVLFIMSGCMTLISGSIIGIFLRDMKLMSKKEESFRFRDIFAYRGNELIFHHALIVFALYIVIAQFMAPLSVYTVDLIGFSKSQLGFLYTLNGLLVAALQIPVTRLLRPVRLTIQLAIGALIYGVGYFTVGLSGAYAVFIVAIVIITIGENMVSPPALSITANLAPEGRVGRYMGIYGFAVTAGWSLGPLLGGTLLDLAAPNYIYAWGIISVLAVMASIGFRWTTSKIPEALNRYQDETTE
jgi:MFS family permease